MPSIGIVDDRDNLRETITRLIDVTLKTTHQEWSVIDIAPFENIDDYLSWINDNNIAILILDEKLQEIQSNVSYNGSELIEKLRENLKDFPVYAITSFPDDPDLKNKFSLFDEILDRNEFTDNPDEYVLRFIRAGQRFLTTHAKHLQLISELSEKIATGVASESDKNELKALQVLLGLSHQDFFSREDWLKKYEEKLNELEQVSLKIEEFLSKLKK